MSRRLLNFAALLLLAACAPALAGCAARATPRPLVRFDGAAVSQLHFPAGQDQFVLPLTLRGAVLVTDAVTVNGRSAGWFVVDTGASWTVLDRQTARQVGLTAREPWAPIDKAHKPDGLYRVDRLAVGDLALSNHVVGVLDFSSLASTPGVRIAGSLGGDVWGGLPFTIDYKKRELVIHRRETFRPPPAAPVHAIRVSRRPAAGPFAAANPSAGQPVVPAVIDGVRTSVVLDTGSDGSLAILPPFAKAHPQFTDGGNPTTRRVVGAGGPGMAGLMLKRAKVGHVDALGARCFCEGTAWVVGGEWDDGGGYGAILGARFLQHGRLTFDYATRRLWTEWQPDPEAVRPRAGR